MSEFEKQESPISDILKACILLLDCVERHDAFIIKLLQQEEVDVNNYIDGHVKRMEEVHRLLVSSQATAIVENILQGDKNG
jgi:hypothetical protein